MPMKYLRNINKKADLINRIGIGDMLRKALEGEEDYANKLSYERSMV